MLFRSKKDKLLVLLALLALLVSLVPIAGRMQTCLLYTSGRERQKSGDDVPRQAPQGMILTEGARVRLRMMRREDCLLYTSRCV